jgi:phosphohistidine phosphatase
MRLYFLRHGHAEDPIGITDAQRALTDYGIKRMQTAAQVMQTLLGGNLHAIYSSSRVRAQQTAEIVGQAMGQTVTIRDELNFGFSISLLKTMLTGQNPEAQLMLVGHEPTLSTVVGQLTGGNVIMKKGSLARVDLYRYDPLQGALVWLIAPRVFDALGAE